MRLNSFLARAGAADSRRKAETIIAAGRVFVNGQVTKDLSTKIDPEHDTVTLDGAAVILPADNVVLMLNKPAGYITSHSDPHAEHIVFELIDCKRYPALSYVGRLDKDTTGLLLFTNDGALAQELTHPKYHVEKTYFAKVQGVPTENELEKLRTGILLKDGITAPAQVSLFKNAPEVFEHMQTNKKQSKNSKNAFLQITIHEGRKRQVKRMCSAIGHKVIALHRQSFGTLDLGVLETGKYRLLSLSEIEELKACVAIGQNLSAGQSASVGQSANAGQKDAVNGAKTGGANTRSAAKKHTI